MRGEMLAEAVKINIFCLLFLRGCVKIVVRDIVSSLAPRQTGGRRPKGGKTHEQV